jgi:hypothetical protein
MKVYGWLYDVLSSRKTMLKKIMRSGENISAQAQKSRTGQRAHATCSSSPSVTVLGIVIHLEL